MIEIKGNAASAKVFTDNIEDVAFSQIRQLCDMEYTRGAKIRIMPDVHAGIGCTIGTTMTIFDKVVPNLVGVDIGCGMENIKLSNKSIDLQKLDKLIYSKIPSGMNIREKPHRYNDDNDLTKLRCYRKIDLINMRDGSLICIGKGNEDWNCSAPHGAGRIMSRTQAKSTFTVSEFKNQMKDIYTTTVSKDTLDECPMAYKNMNNIIKDIEPTARLIKIIKPIYNFKAAE